MNKAKEILRNVCAHIIFVHAHINIVQKNTFLVAARQ